MKDGKKEYIEVEARGPELLPKKPIAERIREDIESGKIKLEKVNMSLYGTKETTEMVLALANFANAVSLSLADDGKITLADLPRLILIAPKFITAVSGVGEIPKELTDLDPVEKEALIETVKQELEFTENVEAIVEQALIVAFAILQLIKLFEPVTE